MCLEEHAGIVTEPFGKGTHPAMAEVWLLLQPWEQGVRDDFLEDGVHVFSGFGCLVRFSNMTRGDIFFKGPVIHNRVLPAFDRTGVLDGVKIRGQQKVFLVEDREIHDSVFMILWFVSD